MDHLVLDKSGKLVSGIFYEFQVLWDDEPPLGRSHPNKGLASYRTPTRDELFIADAKKKDGQLETITRAKTITGSLLVRRNNDIHRF